MLAAAALTASLVALEAGAAVQSAVKVRVSLAVSGATPELTPGDAVRISARAKLPPGERLLIEKRAQRGRKWSPVNECPSSPCTSDWTEQDPGTVTFEALAIHRRSGARGRIVSVDGTSRPIAVVWHEPPPLPPPPPPPPAAAPGHYCGFNDQGKSVCLDVTLDSVDVTNFVTESIVNCTNRARAQWRLSFRTLTPIQADLSFSYSYSGPIPSSDPSVTNIQTVYSIDGRFDTAGNVTGTLAVTSISWDEKGTHYDCSTAPFAWQAKLNA